MPKKISRRTFLKNAAKTTGKIALGGSLLTVAGCAPVLRRRARTFSQGNWPALRKLYRWDPANKGHAAQMDLVRKISGRTRLSAAQVLLSINKNGVKSYHATSVRNTVESNPGRIKKYKHMRRFIWTNSKKNTVKNKKKLDSMISRLEKDLKVAKIDVKVLEAIQKERNSSDKRKQAASDLVRTVKDKFFDGKQLEKLVGK